MPWRGSNGFPYTPLYVQRNAPPQSGVYVLYRPGQRVVYVGESGNIQSCLLEHLDSDNDGIAQHAPSLFAYELVPLYSDRLARARALVLELRPLCGPTHPPLRGVRRDPLPAPRSTSPAPARPAHEAPAS
jgi:hypothetical protein